VDNYIGPKTLLMLKSVPTNVEIIIFSDNIRNILRLSELQSFQTEYPNVKLYYPMIEDLLKPSALQLKKQCEFMFYNQPFDVNRLGI